MAAQVDLPNGLGHQNASMDVAVVQLAQQLNKLRSDIVAGKHPRFHVPEHLRSTVSSSVGDTALSSSTVNGSNAPAHAWNINTPGSSLSDALPTEGATDPKVALCERRKELEQKLEEQIQQKKLMARQKTNDQDVVADFDVMDMLKTAHERVMPFVPNDAANQSNSASDSFDENTFYSSQMNSSTSTEEVDNSKNTRHPTRACRFFRDGKPCPYKEKCTFSHDPAIVKKVEAEEQQQVAARPNNQAHRKSGTSPKASQKTTANPQKVPSQDTQATKIAELEEQLRQLKEAQQPPKPAVVPRAIEREPADTQRPPVQRVPQVDEFGRDATRREVEKQDHSIVRSTFPQFYSSITS